MDFIACVQQFYVSLLTRINTQVAREVSEGEKASQRRTDSSNTFLYPSKIMVFNCMCVKQQGLEMFFPP